MENNLVVKAEYILALSTNNVTDEIRNNYIDLLKKEDTNYLKIFAEIIEIIMKQFRNKTLSKEEAIVIAKNEFLKFSLSDFIGDEKDFFPLIENIFKIREKDKPISLETLKQYINIADTSNNHSITVCIYYSVLNGLLVGGLIDTDIDFSEKVISFIKQYKQLNDDDNLFLRVIMESITYAE